MSAFRLIHDAKVGRPVPAGPMAHRTPIGGPLIRPASKGPRMVHHSKKGYTGTRAGLGRLPNGTVARSGPGGPRRFAGSVLLPNRMAGLPAAAGPRPAKRPSLFARVGQKLRRAAAAFGL